MAKQTPSAAITAIKSRPIARILRFCLGAFLLTLIARRIAAESLQDNLIVAGAIVALLVGYTVIHLAVWRFAPNLNRWLGAVVAIAPAVLVYVFGGEIGQVSAIGYIGGSLVIDGVNGDAGCEVMAVPGILCRKRTHLACLVFSPLDWLEEKLFAQSDVA